MNDALILEKLDQLTAEVQSLKSDVMQDIRKDLEPLLKQLGDIHTRLEQRINVSASNKTFRARQALSKVEGWHRELSQMALKSLSRLHIAPGG